MPYLPQDEQPLFKWVRCHRPETNSWLTYEIAEPMCHEDIWQYMPGALPGWQVEAVAVTQPNSNEGLK